MLGAVTGGVNGLTLETGDAVPGADVSGRGFSGTGLLALQNIGGTASFTGGVTAATLTVAATVENVSLTGATGTIDNLVTFNNPGTLTLGVDGGTLTFTGGVTATAPSGTPNSIMGAWRQNSTNATRDGELVLSKT